MIRDVRSMSHSGRVTLHRCPRKYELDKLIGEREQTIDTLFGTAVGNGVQKLFETSSVSAAIFETFLSWKDSDTLFSEDDNKGKKNVWYAIEAVVLFNTLIDTVFSGHELAYLPALGGNKAACEVGFKIDLGDGYFDRGFIDVVLINKATGKLLLLELKTTKFSKVVDAMFKNSSQALGYSVVVDSISKQLQLEDSDNYFVVYPVYKTKDMEWDIQMYEKSSLNKARWISSILEDKEKISRHIEAECFPMHGESCYDFFRECQFFGMCEMKTSTLMIGIDKTLEVEKEGKYMFNFNIQDIIQQQIEALETE